MKENSENKMKLSIVVPVYNVETTIERAVQSLFENKYKNIEVLLIDDGSTDNSGVICKGLSKKSDKIYCYHKENGGLSSARNFGLKKATGNLIAFLDSDDYYLPGCIDKVMKDFQKNYPDIICFGLKKGKTEEESIELIEKKQARCNNTEAIKLLFKSKAVDFYAWNKVFKKAIFDGIEFPEGKLYEDMVPVYHAFKAAKTIDILDFAGIFYFQNSSSIVYQDFNPKQYDNVTQRKILLKSIKIEFPQYLDLANARLIDGYLSTGFKIGLTKRENPERKKYYDISKMEIKSLLKEVKGNREVSFAKRIALYLYLLNSNLYSVLYKRIIKK
jgi:glycosyltransferase involved in cell wall biosynthesis